MSLGNGVPLPNLFVLGAGKCGTTTLHKLLSEHPLIHMSAIKEPSFFCSYFQVVRNPIDYLQLFQSTREVRYRGESSHVYFTNPETPPVLKALFPDAKFVLVLRDPAKRAHSLFHHMRAAGLESEPSFCNALMMEAVRRNAEYCELPYYPWNFFYLESSRYDVQLSRYLSYFARDCFFILTLAKLASDPQGVMRRLFDFLDMPMVDGLIPQHLNSGGSYPPPDAASEAVLASGLKGVTDRVDALAGESLDWSL